MRPMRAKLIVGGLALAAAVTVLAVAGMRAGWVYFLPVDQFLQDDDYHGQRVRLHGVVGEANLQVDPVHLRASFDLCGDSSQLRVEYDGVVPDLFKAGREVVVEGVMTDDGAFHADTLLTKCASKYESADGQAPHADPRSAEDPP